MSFRENNPKSEIQNLSWKVWGTETDTPNFPQNPIDSLLAYGVIITNYKEAITELEPSNADKLSSYI